jgi:hypothetical protein
MGVDAKEAGIPNRDYTEPRRKGERSLPRREANPPKSSSSERIPVRDPSFVTIPFRGDTFDLTAPVRRTAFNRNS